MTEKKPITARMLGRVWNMLQHPETLVPEEKKPDGKNSGSGKYKTIDFFYARNKFAKDLLLLSEISATHRSCIYTKADFEFADGFGILRQKSQSIIKNKSKIEDTPVEDSVIIAAAELLENVNIYQESLLEVARQVRINLNTSGNGYVELVWGWHLGRKYFNIYSHDFHKVLFVMPDEGRNTATHVYISEDWNESYINKKAPTRLPIYPLIEEINGSFRTVIHVKEYSIGRDFYGLPLFIASKSAAQIEYESDRHNLERFFSDFMPKFFASFFAPNGMTEPEKEKFYEEFLNTYTKRGRGGSVQAMVQVFESEAMKPFFHEFNNKDSDGDFINLKSSSNQTIFTAHRWHPVLAAVPIAGGLNDAKQIQNIFSIYNKITINPNQVFDLNNFINPVFNMMNEWLDTTCKGHQLTLESSSPISFFENLEAGKFITVDEARSQMGMSLIGDERGSFMVSEIGQQFNIQKEGRALTDGSIEKE